MKYNSLSCNTADSEINGNSSNEVMETQHATCNITTEELAASAQATVTRVLTGVCNARETNERFDKLESELKERFNEIKKMMDLILQRSAGTLFEKEEEEDLLISQKSKRNEMNNVMPRQDEINRFNNTVHQMFTTSGPIKVFTYYWRVTDLNEKLSQWEPGCSQRSPTFYANQKKYGMYLRITPRRSSDNSIFVSFGVTYGLYDSTVLGWSDIPFKIRIEILDHSADGLREDRSSRILDSSMFCSRQFWNRPTGQTENLDCGGLSVPRHIVLPFTSNHRNVNFQTRYIWDNSLMIKLTVYL